MSNVSVGSRYAQTQVVTPELKPNALIAPAVATRRIRRGPDIHDFYAGNSVLV
jgi:hypothetical protein